MNVIELARQAGFLLRNGRSDFWMSTTNGIERFAALVRQEERERCAKMCTSHPELAAAIRGVKDE